MKYEIKDANGNVVREGSSNIQLGYFRLSCIEKRGEYAELWIDGKCVKATNVSEKN